MIDGDVFIEDLVREHPSSVRFLAERGIKCIACGEPIWGTLAEAARDRGLSPEAVTLLVRDLDAWIARTEHG